MKQTNQLSKFHDWKLWMGLFISALFLYLAFRKVDLSQMWAVIKSANLYFLALIVIFCFLQFIARVWRWNILLEPVAATRFRMRLHATLVGFAANCILPARLGEFIRANTIGRAENISGSAAFGTIVVERLFDGFTLLLVLLIGLMGTAFPEEWQSISRGLRATGSFLLLFYVLLIFFLVGFKYKTTPFLSLLDRLLFFLPGPLRSKCLNMIRNFSLGLVLTKKPHKWVLILFYSLLIWFLNLYQIELVSRSLGISVPFIATFLIMAMASFGVMIPSAPAYIGTFHLSVMYGFLFFGLGKEEALSAAILWHAAIFIPTILFAFCSFAILQLPLNGLKKAPTVSSCNDNLGKMEQRGQYCL